MDTKSIFKIKWLHSHIDHYKYGALIRYFHSTEKVIFENNFMPAGTTLVRWLSNPNYQANRSVIQLPILKRKHTYSLSTSICTIPQDSVMFKISFYNRGGTIIHSLGLGSKGGEFLYPKSAFSYSIEIINTGVKKLIFDSLYLNEKENFKVK